MADGGLPTQYLAGRTGDAEMVDGYVDVPSGPGLGIDLDWTVIERFRVG